MLAGGCANALDKFHATQTSFASEAASPPSLYNIVPKREGEKLLPYIHHSETSLGWYVPDKPLEAVERCEFIYYLAEEKQLD